MVGVGLAWLSDKEKVAPMVGAGLAWLSTDCMGRSNWCTDYFSF
jgi:hypothetical protein